MPSAGRCCWIAALKVLPLYVAVAATSTGQPGLMSPVSMLREMMRCFMVSPPSGVVIASKNSAREGRSTIGVPMMPMGSNLVHSRSPADTGGPTLRSQITVPSTASSAHTIRFRYGNDRRPAAWAAVDVKRLRVNVAHDCAVEIQVACQIRCGVEREGGINIETVPRIVIVELGNVDLSASL